jgi:NADH:ubiquinone oxidoreductase subunit 6 (subunit J)
MVGVRMDCGRRWMGGVSVVVVVVAVLVVNREVVMVTEISKEVGMKKR